MLRSDEISYIFRYRAILGSLRNLAPPSNRCKGKMDATNGITKQKKRVNKSRSARAGLIMPVGRVARMLKSSKVADRVSGDSSLYLTAVLQYLALEVISLAGKEAVRDRKKTITPRYVQLGARKDNEMRELLGTVTIGEGGVMPHVAASLG